MRKSNVYILIVLSFIFGSTVTLFFVSLDDISKPNSIYTYSKFGHSVYYGNITNRYFMLILIITSPDNFSKRNTIRETWLQFIQDDKSVKYLFVVGTKGISYESEKRLTNEYLNHRDIISLNKITDSYRTLSSKVLTSFVLIEKEYDFKFVLKCDDDSFVQASDIVKELKRRFHNERLLYWGYFDGRARVKRIGKWKEENWILCDHYLPYALGGGYIISYTLVKFISMNAEFLSLYKSEDVSVGVWLAPLNITRVHDERFDTEFVSRGCLNNYLITHKISEKSMRHLYSETVTHGRMCLTEVQLKPSYIYNWKTPPSQCCFRNESDVVHSRSAGKKVV